MSHSGCGRVRMLLWGAESEDIKMDIAQYIKPEMLVLVPVLWMIGAALKRTPKVPDWSIPYALAGFGIAGAGMWVCAAEGVSLMALFTAFTQGVLVAGASVWGNQLVRQAGKKDDGKGD